MLGNSESRKMSSTQALGQLGEAVPGQGQRMNVGTNGNEEMQAFLKGEEDKEDDDDLTIIEPW
jgi:hypothetical protein